MDEKKDILEETTIENPDKNDLSQAPTPVEEITPAPASEETEALKAASEAERKKTYKTGSKVAAFIFFFITLGVFAVYEFCASTFLYSPLINGINDFGEAIAAVFGYSIGLVFTMIFGVAQLPENIISIILFKRLRGKSDKKWENRLFTVMFALSIVMLLLMIITIGLFFIIVGTNK